MSTINTTNLATTVASVSKTASDVTATIGQAIAILTKYVTDILPVPVNGVSGVPAVSGADAAAYELVGSAINDLVAALNRTA